MTWLDVLGSWLMTVPGFTVGMVAGWVLRDHWGDQMRTKFQLLTSGAAQVLIVSLVLLIAGLAFVSTRESDQRTREGDQRIVECVQRYNEARDAASRPRTDAIEQRDEALSKVVDAVPGVLGDAPTASDRARLLASVTDFRRLDADLREARAQNPYPDPPTRLCED